MNTNRTHRLVDLFGAATIISALIAPFILWSGPANSEQSSTTNVRNQQERRFYASVGFLDYIKKSLRDPSSFDVVSVHTDDEPTLICVKYRARNGFGGLNVEIAMHVNGVISRSPADWATYCANRGLHNLTSARRAL